ANTGRLRAELRAATTAQQELERRMFHLKSLYDLGREIGSLLDSQLIMKNALLMVIGTFGTFRGAVALADPVRRAISASAHRGMAEASTAAFGEVVLTGCANGVATAAKSRKRRAASPSTASPMRGLRACDLQVWVPFPVNDELTGGLGLGEKMTGEPYT